MTYFVYKGPKEPGSKRPGASGKPERSFRGLVFPEGEPVEVTDPKTIAKLHVLDAFDAVEGGAPKAEAKPEVKKSK